MSTLHLVPPELLLPSDVARRLKVNERTVRRWCQEGRLRAFRTGKVVRIYEDSLTDALRSGTLPQAPGADAR